MKERPILFSGPMVRAVLAGTKTQTRRIVKPGRLGPSGLPCRQPTPNWNSAAYGPGIWGDGLDFSARCPYGVPGDRLWVREAWHTDTSDLSYARAQHEDVMSSSPICYRADPVHHNAGCMWRPSIHMPRWASRITLEVTDVRVERLQEISEADALAEGKPTDSANSPRIWYSTIWQSINGPGSWALNPWVWVVSFRRMEAGR